MLGVASRARGCHSFSLSPLTGHLPMCEVM